MNHFSARNERAWQLDEKQRYTIDEACTYLRMSRARLYEKILAGELRIIKDGRRSYVPGSEIVRLSQVPQ